MKDYSLKNKIKLLKEIGYFPKNNFCNLTGVTKDIQHLKEYGINVEYDGWDIKFHRELKNFFRFGAYMQHYSTLIYPIARYYLAIEKEGKTNEIDYSFEEYIKMNLKDTLSEYQKLIRHKDIKVNDCYSEKIKTTVIEEAYKIDFLNTQIAGSKKEIIMNKVKELILKYYKDFDFDVFEDESSDEISIIIYDYLSDNLQVDNGDFINVLTDEVETGSYYKLDECVEYGEELYDSGCHKQYFDEFINKENNLEFIKKEIQKIIQENDVDEEEVEYIDYIKKSIYSDEEVINFIKKHKIFDKNFLSNFYKNLSNERIENLIEYYNNKIWDNYSKDKEEYNYYYYFFNKHLEKKFL